MKTCKKHNVEYLNLLEGEDCPVCVKIEETKEKIKNYKKKTNALLDTKKSQITKIQADAEKVILAMEGMITGYTNNPQKVYEDAKKEAEVLNDK